MEPSLPCFSQEDTSLPSILIGAHVSIAGNLLKAVTKAKDIGANCIQIFSSPPQSWTGPKFSEDTLNEFRASLEKENISPVFVHALYLINLASDNSFLRKSSITALKEDLNFASLIGARGVIFHLGSHPLGWSGSKREELMDSFKRVLEDVPDNVSLLVENVAGGGTKLGSTFAQLGEMKNDINDPHLGFCIDTAHTFESGYDMRTKENVDDMVDLLNQTVGAQNVLAIHCNDSKTDLSSHNDRHENIGEGKIRIEGFRALLNHRLMKDKPFILETPGFDSKGPDAKNVEILKNLISSVN
ncbi:MAG: deoxyribonuclease IV [bacterium]|nr:deoxyribonuclease IV [bacterium]